jgi:hypothetical protein
VEILRIPYENYYYSNLGEDFWRWQTMNPNGYKGEAGTGSNGLNGNHANGNGIAQEANGGR